LLLLASAACEREASLGRGVNWPDGAAPCDPRAAEICNGRDDNCDGVVDEGNVCDGSCRAVRIGRRSALLNDGEVRANLCLASGHASIRRTTDSPFSTVTEQRLATSGAPTNTPWCEATQMARSLL
jgi:hypothetical protein